MIARDWLSGEKKERSADWNVIKIDPYAHGFFTFFAIEDTRCWSCAGGSIIACWWWWWLGLKVGGRAEVLVLTWACVSMSASLCRKIKKKVSFFLSREKRASTPKGGNRLPSSQPRAESYEKIKYCTYSFLLPSFFRLVVVIFPEMWTTRITPPPPPRWVSFHDAADADETVNYGALYRFFTRHSWRVKKPLGDKLYYIMSLPVPASRIVVVVMN